jgi:hypothetical protein
MNRPLAVLRPLLIGFALFWLVVVGILGVGIPSAAIANPLFISIARPDAGLLAPVGHIEDLIPVDNSKRVLIIGIDGLRGDAVAPANAPTLDMLIANGAFSLNTLAGDRGQGTWSAPGWGTVVSSVWADKHNVYNNSQWGQGNFDEYPHFFSRIKSLNPAITTASIVHWEPINTYLALPQFTDVREAYPTDPQVVTRAVTLLSAANAPQVSFVHLDDVDHAGHNCCFSLTDADYLNAIGTVDGQVNQILTAIQNRPTYAQEDWLIAVVSDHGGINSGHGGQTPEEKRAIMGFYNTGSEPFCNVGLLIGTATQADLAPHVMSFLDLPVQVGWGWEGRVNARCGNQSVLFEETFDGLTPNLQPRAMESGIPANILGWTHTPPTGWSVTNAPTMPQGTTEWQGWSFTTMNFWSRTQTGQARDAFTLQNGVFVVADSDEYDDFCPQPTICPPANFGDFDSTMTTPAIPVTGGRALRLEFDSHYRQEANQTASVLVRFNDGTSQTLLFYNGQSTSDNGGGDAQNRHIIISFSVPASGTTMTLEFHKYLARNNWYWAIDNVYVIDETAPVVTPTATATAATTPTTTPASPTRTPTNTPPTTPTILPTRTPKTTRTPINTPIPSHTPTSAPPTNTPIPSLTSTPAPPTNTPTPSFTPTPAPPTTTATIMPTRTPKPTRTPTPS